MKYKLPPLDYNYDALEPHLDGRTVKIHYTQYHQNYLDNLNDLLNKYPDIQKTGLEDLLRSFDSLDLAACDKMKFINNAGGYLNHNFYWKIMGPVKRTDQILANELKREFGSLEQFKKEFNDKANSHIGSGWVWLVHDHNNQLQIYSTTNHDSPYLQGHVPVMAMDLWEHAYYLQYQIQKAEYIKNWWQVVNLI